MTKNPEVTELTYWLTNPDWYTKGELPGTEHYLIKPDAPERAKKSYEAWKKHNNLK